jgi:transcriptional regulator with XRE-family HTH domain
MSQKAIFPNRPTGALVARAQARLGMTHRQFGEALGASERTATRWAAGRSSVGVPKLRTLARLVHPRDPALAAELAEATSATLESLGIVAPPAPAPAPPAADASVLVDVVVCAAADALSMAPSAVRGALLAAFARARELGLSVEDVEKAIGARLQKSAASSGTSASA